MARSRHAVVKPLREKSGSNKKPAAAAAAAEKKPKKRVRSPSPAPKKKKEVVVEESDSDESDDEEEEAEPVESEEEEEAPVPDVSDAMKIKTNKKKKTADAAPAHRHRSAAAKSRAAQRTALGIKEAGMGNMEPPLQIAASAKRRIVQQMLYRETGSVVSVSKEAAELIFDAAMYNLENVVLPQVRDTMVAARGRSEEHPDKTQEYLNKATIRGTILELEYARAWENSDRIGFDSKARYQSLLAHLYKDPKFVARQEKAAASAEIHAHRAKVEKNINLLTLREELDSLSREERTELTQLRMEKLTWERAHNAAEEKRFEAASQNAAARIKEINDELIPAARKRLQVLEDQSEAEKESIVFSIDASEKAESVSKKAHKIVLETRENLSKLRDALHATQAKLKAVKGSTSASIKEGTIQAEADVKAENEVLQKQTRERDAADKEFKRLEAQVASRKKEVLKIRRRLDGFPAEIDTQKKLIVDRKKKAEEFGKLARQQTRSLAEGRAMLGGGASSSKKASASKMDESD